MALENASTAAAPAARAINVISEPPCWPVRSRESGAPTRFVGRIWPEPRGRINHVLIYFKPLERFQTLALDRAGQGVPTAVVVKIVNQGRDDPAVETFAHALH